MSKTNGNGRLVQLNMENYTPTERKILRMFDSGRPVSSDVLVTCLVEDLGTRQELLRNLAYHIHNLRRKMPIGEDILRLNGTRGSSFYQRVRSDYIS